MSISMRYRKPRSRGKSEHERPKGSVIWVNSDGSWSYRPLPQLKPPEARPPEAGEYVETRRERLAAIETEGEPRSRGKSEHERSMAWIDRSSRWSFRLLDQEERIAKTRRMEEDRHDAQEDRIMRQRVGEYSRAYGPDALHVPPTTLDYFAKRRRYFDHKWTRKWELRKAKMDHRRY